MGQTLSQNFHLQRCEPGVAHGAVVAEPAFGVRSRKPVSAELEGDGEMHSTGIAFSDFSRMNTFTRKPVGERRLPTPSWAVNQEELRGLLVHFFERRAWNRKIPPRNGSLIQRLNAAQRMLLSRVPWMTDAIDRLSREYVAVTSTDPERARSLRIQIQNLDTRIRMARMGPGGVARIVHLYYSVGMDSCGVGSEIGITPMHVRRTLWRLHSVANGEPAQQTKRISELTEEEKEVRRAREHRRRARRLTRQ